MAKSVIVPFGPPEGGKSTLCRHLPDYRIESFADPLYRIVGYVIDDAQRIERMRACNEKNEPIPELGGKTLREALQTLGTEWGREMMYQDIWADRLFRKTGNDSRLCIDDLRFDNEYARAAKAGALFVRLKPHRALRQDGWAGHVSESYWRTFAAHVEVGWDTLPELKQAAKVIYAHREYLLEQTPSVDDVPDFRSFL